jgi:hypothetical protein
MLESATSHILCSQIYIRLDGVGDAIKRELMQARSFNFAELVSLLQQLKIPTKPSDPVHVELLVRVQNKAVVVHYANQSTLNSFFQGENSLINHAAGPTVITKAFWDVVL